MNTLREYLENLPVKRSSHYWHDYELTLNEQETLTLAAKIIENCILECNDNYPINETDNIYYTWQDKKFSLPFGMLSYDNTVIFWLSYGVHGHNNLYLKIAIPMSEFRTMLIDKSITYNKE